MELSLAIDAMIAADVSQLKLFSDENLLNEQIFLAFFISCRRRLRMGSPLKTTRWNTLAGNRFYGFKIYVGGVGTGDSAGSNDVSNLVMSVLADGSYSIVLFKKYWSCV